MHSTPSKSTIRTEKLAQRQALGAAEHTRLSAILCEHLRNFLEQKNEWNPPLPPGEGRGEGVDILTKFHSLTQPSPGGRGLFASIIPTRSEPDIAPVNEGLGTEKILALPVVGNDKILRFREVVGAALTTNRFGILEPAADAAEISPDIVLIPCVAFDRRGYRIGYGGGYYDATLAHLRAQGSVLAVGIAFGFQEVPAIPAEPQDARMDVIITESGYFAVG